MFERTRIDNRHGEIEKVAISVELTMKSGEIVAGRLQLPTTRSLGDELNAPGGFLELESFTGDKYFLAKSQVLSIRSMIVPRADQLTRNSKAAEGFDPHAVLQVPPGADRETVRNAYHRLAKIYHPDRFAGLELPSEVTDYLSAVARRVNVAYSVMQASVRPIETGPRTQPPPKPASPFGA